ncbi:MAG: hypothetical protein FIB08_06735 [Candidatus Methanoperedens sp.]|nr:hypothetical protein [Candidatus Methanoperedens sp.]
MEGLNGDIINLARDAEAGIKKNNNTDALAFLLEARRHEKNFVKAPGTGSTIPGFADRSLKIKPRNSII